MFEDMYTAEIPGMMKIQQKPIFLKASDFCSIENLPTIQSGSFANPKPKFINENWLETQTKIIIEKFNQSDVNGLVPSMAFVAHSGSEKTRTLKEIARNLQRKNIPVIFIAFNFGTEYSLHEIDSELLSILSSLVLPLLSPNLNQLMVNFMIGMESYNLFPLRMKLSIGLEKIPVFYVLMGLTD
jgi:hypothetical protein